MRACAFGRGEFDCDHQALAANVCDETFGRWAGLDSAEGSEEFLRPNKPYEDNCQQKILEEAKLTVHSHCRGSFLP